EPKVPGSRDIASRFAQAISLSWMRSARVELDDELNVTGDRHLFALRGTQQGGLQALEVHIEVAGHCRENVLVATAGGDLERIHRCRTLVHLNRLCCRHAEGGAVHALSVDRDVTVDDELTGLCHGAGEAGTQHEGVETRFEELAHGL